MRILLIGPAFRLPGGIQYVGHLMAEGLAAIYGSALELDVLSLLDGEDSCVRAPTVRWTGCGGHRARFLRALRNGLRQRPDLVLINHVHLLPYLGVAAAGLRTGTLAIVMHGIEAWRPLSRFRQVGLGRVTRMIYVSDFTRRRAIETNPRLAEIDARVCHHALLPGDVAGLGDPIRAVSEGAAPFVLMIGRMSSQEQYKGYEEVIRVWPRMRALRPGLELVLVGDGDDRPRLQAIAAGVEGVRFTGQISDSERDQLIQDCAAFALPSRGEGFGLVYLEAMKAGKPVIAGSLDAGAEVIVEGVTGRAIDPRNSEDVLRTLAEATSASGIQLGAAGRRRYLEQFTFESYTERLRTAVEGN